MRCRRGTVSIVHNNYHVVTLKILIAVSVYDTDRQCPFKRVCLVVCFLTIRRVTYTLNFVLQQLQLALHNCVNTACSIFTLEIILYIIQYNFTGRS